MKSNDTDVINEINFTKRCILMSVISQEKNIVLINSFHKIPIVKLFTADSTSEKYDLKDYSLLFNIEIRKEYMQYITQYKEDFYFLELRESFLGFKFLSKESGRLFFLLLNEDPKKEVLDQNERAMNIKSKDIAKTTNKVIDYIKMRLKYTFENSGKASGTNYRKRDISSQKKELFPTMIINDKKGEYLDTSKIPYYSLKKI